MLIVIGMIAMGYIELGQPFGALFVFVSSILIYCPILAAITIFTDNYNISIEYRFKKVKKLQVLTSKELRHYSVLLVYEMFLRYFFLLSIYLFVLTLIYNQSNIYYIFIWVILATLYSSLYETQQNFLNRIKNHTIQLLNENSKVNGRLLESNELESYNLFIDLLDRVPEEHKGKIEQLKQKNELYVLHIEKGSQLNNLDIHSFYTELGKQLDFYLNAYNHLISEPVD